MSELHIFYFYFFQFAPGRFPCTVLLFSVTHRIIALLETFFIDILFYAHPVQAFISEVWCNCNNK